MSAPAPIRNGNLKVVSIPVSQGSNRIGTHLDATTTPGSLVGGLVNIGESRQIVTIVKAGETVYVPQAGLSYYLEFLGTTAGIPNNFAGLHIRAMQKGQPRSDVIHVQGTGLRFGTFSFSGLQIFNPSASDALFTLGVGGGVANNSYDEFIDNRVIISNTGGAAVVVITAPGTNLSVVPGISSVVAFKTRVPAWADSLGATTTQDITDGYLGKTRRSVVIANDDVAAVLLVFDAAGNTLGSVQPGTSFYLETAGDIKVNNPTANPVVCHIGEVYFT